MRAPLTGAVVTGLSAALAGYVWVGFEFPFAIVLPAFAGLLAVLWPLYDRGRVLLAAALGGIAFTGAFLVAVFLALTDGSPFALPAWAGAIAAAAVAGVVTGALLEGRRGALVMAAYSSLGMLLAVGVAAVMRTVAPAGVDVEGVTQTAYFALLIGLVGLVMGAFIGAGADRMHRPTR